MMVIRQKVFIIGLGIVLLRGTARDRTGSLRGGRTDKLSAGKCESGSDEDCADARMQTRCRPYWDYYWGCRTQRQTKSGKSHAIKLSWRVM